MTRETSKLTAYTLKLSEKDRQRIKLICAFNPELKYQYSFFDEAVNWANTNKDSLFAIANPKNGSNKSYYLSDSVDLLDDLETEWNCNTTRALYTCVVLFLKFRENEIKELNSRCSNLVEGF